MQWKLHVRFGGRAGETHSMRVEQGAPVRPDAQGGLTALDNLARICRRHHLDRTHRGFELTSTPDGWVWTAPEHPITPKRPKPKRRPKGGAPPPDTGPPLFGQPPLDESPLVHRG